MRSLAVLLVLSLAVHAQEPQDVVRISTNLVQVDVVVTKNGKHVPDLKLEDFEIREDGHVQQITNFAFISVNPSPKKSATGTPPPSTTTPPIPTDVKRTVAIVVDDLGMSFESMSNLRQYLRKFVAESLRPNDLVAIVRTGGEVGALQQFTTDSRVLANAIAELKWNPCSRVGVSVLTPERSLVTQIRPEPEMRGGRVPSDRSPGSNQVQRQTTANESSPCSSGNSVNYSLNAIRFILRGMQDLPGRKSLMIVSDNLPMERQENPPADFGLRRPVTDYANLIDVWTQATVYNDGLHGIAEQAIRSSVVIYGVSSQRLQTTGVQPSDELGFPPQHMVGGRSGDTTQPNNNPLSRLMNSRSAELQKNFDGAELMAKETGGFVIRNQNDFGIDRVLEDQNGYYLIGYRPATETFKRQLHKIQVRVKRGGFAVRTRAGFYGVTENAAAGPPSERDRMNKALISPFGAQDIAVRLKSFFVNDPDRGSLLRNFLVVDAKALTFYTEHGTGPSVKYELSYVLLGENGAVVDRQDFPMITQLSHEAFERAQREGMVYVFNVPLKQAGSFQLRVALRDDASRRIGSASQFVQAPDLSEGQLALSSVLLYAEAPNMEPDDWNRALVLRRFRPGASLVFGYTIYNAALEHTGHPNLLTQTVVYRDSLKIYSSDRAPVTVAEQLDLKRISAGARLQLGRELTPGEYVVQIVVEDQVAKRTTTQLTQFEVK